MPNYHDRIRVQTTTTLPSRTKQAGKDEVNVNFIVENFRRTGALPPRSNAARAVYGDYSSVDDFHSQANRMLAAQEAFDSLPAKTRRAFGDDPQELVARYFSDDPADRELLIEHDLVEATPEDRQALEAAKAAATPRVETPAPSGAEDGAASTEKKPAQ